MKNLAQRKWQNKNIAEGKCRICGQPLYTAWHCLYHTEQHRNQARNAYRRKHGIPLGAPLKPGRPRKKQKPKPPRYDKVYEDGVKWLDSL